MNKIETKISELSFLFRMLQVAHELGSVEKVYRMLLAFSTCGSAIGFKRAMLFNIEYRSGTIRGTLASEDPGGYREDRPSFGRMAREAFERFEAVESGDLTLKVKTFSVPMSWYRSALVKAARSAYPVLAEGRFSEFATDPFFEFFGSKSYVAIPVKVKGTVTAVLAADNGPNGGNIDIGDVSLIYSLSNQAAIAIENLAESADSRRKLGVLSKLDKILDGGGSREEFEKDLKLAMARVCRAVGGNGCFLKNYTKCITLYAKAAPEFSPDVDRRDLGIADCFEKILDRASGKCEVVRGDCCHPLLDETAARSVRFFSAYPLVACKQVVGAFAVYVEGVGERGRKDFSWRDKTFLEISAYFFASAINTWEKDQHIIRNEEFLEEVRSNLIRERGRSRLGERALEYSERVRCEVEQLKGVLSTARYPSEPIKKAREILSSIEKLTTGFLEGASSAGSSLRLMDLFRLTQRIASSWRKDAQARGIEVIVRIPSKGPLLLMDKEKISLALRSIMDSVASSLKGGDRVLIECSATEDKVLVCLADTGAGLPGDLLSRLFMPFRPVGEEDERKSALSLAGDILHAHAGEISIKTSLNWRTILVLGFPRAANRDRRKRQRDRRVSAEKR